jgi:mannose-6-phosphate isomerase-like protein (cupin superfamily)
MRTVTKPWGKEEIWAETPRYVGKYLYINPHSRLSRQYHNRKEETIRVIEGELILETQSEPGKYAEVVMLPGQIFHVTPGTIHRFGARDSHVLLVEVSTPELDDVVRLEDDYER